MEQRTGAYYIARGMEYYGAGDQENALIEFEKAYTYVPDEPEVLFHLARIYHALDDFEQAKALYEILIEDHPNSARKQEAETYLGYINEALNGAAGTTQ
mgnify:CR=1 FL=1